MRKQIKTQISKSKKIQQAEVCPWFTMRFYGLNACMFIDGWKTNYNYRGIGITLLGLKVSFACLKK